MITTVLTISSCTPNQAYRTGNITSCSQNQCETSFLEKHQNYDLAFVEFTDRGNLFSRKKYKQIIQHILNVKKNSDVRVMVYVHGWKHNASNVADGDVRKFRKLLDIESSKTSNQKLIGVYIGWRGLTIDVPLVNELTYWARKNTAHQVGSGGLTEVLAELEAITKESNDSYVVIGHSFGAAATLSALKEILIQKLVSKKIITPTKEHVFAKIDKCLDTHVLTESFGDGVYFLNPAVEANELFQIKNIVSENSCYSPEQPKLLHILTSIKDFDTKVWFFIGQQILSAYRNENVLYRDYVNHKTGKPRTIKIYEEGFNAMTIGNAPYYRTHLIKTGCNGDNPDETCVIECLDSAGDKKGDCVYSYQKKYNIPVPPYSPLSIQYVDEEFIKNHNDVFNTRVYSYISTGIESNRDKKKLSVVNACKKNNRFSFKKCIDYHRKIYAQQISN